MTASTVTFNPEPPVGSGLEATAETQVIRLLENELGAHVIEQPLPNRTWHTTSDEVFDRATRPDFDRWLAGVTRVGECTRPIRLQGEIHTVKRDTGEIVHTFDTRDLPDGVVYVACGDRRASICPSCAETYRQDAYQLVRAGMAGGKGVPESVATHPAVFATLTAPSFGIVHTQPTKNGRILRCRPRRKPQPCRHGRDLRCSRTHREGEACLGKPLCPDCYDYQAAVVWNVHTGELWRRTTMAIRRRLERIAKANHARIKVSFGKVAEYQARGQVHFHALIRLDGHEPDDPDAWPPPPTWMTTAHLEDAIRDAVVTVWFATRPHPVKPDGWDIHWGDQLDIRSVNTTGSGEISEQAVAGYIAKYATKSTEAVGVLAKRITPDTLEIYAAERTHAGRMIATCWNLGGRNAPNPYGRLRRWAHMLGFGGHFFTKSRRYSTTFGMLRAARRQWRRRQARVWHTDLAGLDPDDTIDVPDFTYIGTGWHTNGDYLLALTSAAQARSRKQVAREEVADPM